MSWLSRGYKVECPHHLISSARNGQQTVGIHQHFRTFSFDILSRFQTPDQAQSYLTMPFTTFFSSVFMSAALCVKLPLDTLQSRQDGCEVYGDYPEYTGPCEDTSKMTGYQGIWNALIRGLQIVVPKAPTAQKLLRVALSTRVSWLFVPAPPILPSCY